MLPNSLLQTLSFVSKSNYMVRRTISRESASMILCVSTRTIDRMLRDGRIEGYKPYGSSRVLIFEDSITPSNLMSNRPIYQNAL